MRKSALSITLAAIVTLSATADAQSPFNSTSNSPFATPGDRFGSVVVGGMENAASGQVPFQGSYMGPLNSYLAEPSFIVGAKNYNSRRGAVTVISANTGNELWTSSQRLYGNAIGDYFGTSVAKTIDIYDGFGNLSPDGNPDIIIGAPQTAGGNNTNGPRGFVKIVSSAGTGGITIQGQIPNEQFGIYVGTVGNLVLVTGNRAQTTPGISLAGRIYVYRAADIVAQQSAVAPACVLSGIPLTTSSQPADRFGYRWVYLPNGPGNAPTLAVGAPLKDTQRGGLYLFNMAAIQACTGGANITGHLLNFDPDLATTETDFRLFGEEITTSVQSGATLLATGAPQRTLFDRFGDEFTAVVRYDQIGAAYLFRNVNTANPIPTTPPTGSNLPQLATPEVIYGPLAQKHTYFGRAMAMTADKLFVGSVDDGPTSLLGTPTAPGSISVYSTVNAQTTYSHLVHAPNAQTGNFGASIAIGGSNGSVIAVSDSGIENGVSNDSRLYTLNLGGLGNPLVTHYGDGCSRASGVPVMSTVMGRPIIGEELSAFVQNVNNMVQKAAVTYTPGKLGSPPTTLQGIACPIPGIYPNAPIIGHWFSYNPDSSPAMYAGAASVLTPLQSSSVGLQFVTTVAAMDPVNGLLYLSNFQKVLVRQW